MRTKNIKKFTITVIVALLTLLSFVSCKKVSDNTQNNELDKNSAVIYIGMDDEFKEYNFEYTENITPEILIQQISELTGWNLDIVGDVKIEDYGMKVCFAKTSAIFTGAPEEQKDEFFVYDMYQLCQEIFDSVKRTLQYNFGESDVYFCTENDEPITIDSNIIIPADKPYTGFYDNSGDIYTAECKFGGLNDGHSVEVVIDGNVEVLQVYDEGVLEKIRDFDLGDTFKCEYLINTSTNMKTITKIIE